MTRAHLMPLFSRLGPYDVQLLTDAAETGPRKLFDYWGHAASLIDVELAPALEYKRAGFKVPQAVSSRLADDPQFLDRLNDALGQGPLTAKQLPGAESGSGSWWGWSVTKHAAEYLWATGKWGVAGRTPSFERRYDLIDRVLPPNPDPLTVEESHRVLVRRAAKALGVASVRCLADYFRIPVRSAAAAVRHLEKSGELEPVIVTGWNEPVWLWSEAIQQPPIEGTTILSPFDSLVFERRRLAALFEFDYKIEIYTPEVKRQYGYYVYPVLIGDELVARVDLKADRANRQLHVKSAWLEPELASRQSEVAEHLAGHLGEVASWQGLDEVVVFDRGDLAAQLKAARDRLLR